MNDYQKSNLKNVKMKAVEVTLDRPRLLKYTMNSFAALEDKFGSIEEAMKALEAKSIKAFRTFLWAGLIHEDETLTENQVGNLLDLDNMQDLVEKMSGVIVNSLPENGKKGN